MILVLLAVFSATFQPPRPTVGDRIVINFPAPVVLDASKDYEVVEQKGNRAVIRSFQPAPFALSGTSGNVRFQNLVVPMTSVLTPNDDLKPAPLRPPQPVPYPRAPFVALGVAAAIAVATWAGVWWFSRRPKAAPVVPAIPVDERFRRAVLAAKTQPERWAALADATRAYLAETRTRLSSDLTTTELVARLREDERIVSAILRQGDLEKFSLSGAEPEDFDEVADRALRLAS
jgi:hypothetical protein